MATQSVPWLMALIPTGTALLGFAFNDMLTRRREARQELRAVRERNEQADRAQRDRSRHDREDRYQRFHEAAEAFPAEVADGRGTAALTSLRQAAGHATYRAENQVRSAIHDTVPAAERWVRLAAANSSSSSAVVEARETFESCCLDVNAAIEADLNQSVSFLSPS